MLTLDAITTATRIECGDRTTWLAERRRGITSTDAPAILGETPDAWSGPFAVYVSKTRGIESVHETNRMRAGRYLERGIRPWLEEESGVRLVTPPEFSLFRSASMPLLLTSVDSFGFLATRPDPGIVELKNVGPGGQDKWDEPPRMYLTQVQHQLRVTQLRWAWLVACLPGPELKWWPIERDDQRGADLERTLLDWWERHVILGDAPEPDGRKTTSTLLTELFGHETGATVELGDDGARVHAEYLAWSRREKEAERERRKRQQMLIARIGEATQGLLPDGRRMTSAIVTMPETIHPPSTSRRLWAPRTPCAGYQ